MPNRNFDDITCFNGVCSQITSDGLHILATLDTTGYSGGVNFYAASPQLNANYTDGTYQFRIVHSDELTTGYENVPEEHIIGDATSYPFLDDLKITGTLGQGKAMPFVQATNLKQYVGLYLEASGVTTGALVQVNYLLSKDSQPVERDGDNFEYFQG